MIIIPKEPYKTLHGVVKGINPEDPEMRFYFRTNKVTGDVYACKCPTQTKPPTAAQLAARQRFIEQYGAPRPPEGEVRGERTAAELPTGERREDYS